MLNILLSTLSSNENKLVEYKTFSKNEILFHEDDFCNSIGIVLSGQIDIVSYSFEGDELVYNSLTSNMVFGNNLLFSSKPQFKGSVICKQNSNVAFINKENLIKLLQSNGLFLKEYLRIQSDFGKDLNSQIKLLSYSSASERFLYYLYSNNKVITYTTISDLALKVHLKRETLSRLLSDLEKRHLIRRLDKRIILIDK